VNCVSPGRFLLTAILIFIMAQNVLDAQGTEARPPVEIMISVAEQRLALVEDGVVVKRFPVSTSKFGLGDNFGSYKTPIRPASRVQKTWRRTARRSGFKTSKL
jgi:hypothetical protein